MRVLTLTQPWASLIAAGIKITETRDWLPTGNGEKSIKPGDRLAIHASKKVPSRNVLRGYLDDKMTEIMGEDWRKVIPTGVVLCTVVYLGGFKVDRWDGEFAVGFKPDGSGETRVKMDLWGTFEPGRAIWLLGDLRVVEKPVPLKGQLGIFNFDPPTDFKYVGVENGQVEQPSDAPVLEPSKQPTLFDLAPPRTDRTRRQMLH